MKKERQSRKTEAKQLAKRLYLSDLWNRNEIAQKANVTPKTLRKWITEWQKEQAPNIDMINNCINRLNEKLADPQADPTEVKILVDTLGKLEKRLY